MTNPIHLVAVPCTESSLAKGTGQAHERYTRMINFRGGSSRVQLTGSAVGSRMLHPARPDPRRSRGECMGASLVQCAADDRGAVDMIRL